jgi:hypothetical protein
MSAHHPDNNRNPAQWVGVAHRVGSSMCYWFTPESGTLIANTSIQHVIHNDYINPSIKQQIDSFNIQLAEHLDNTNFTINNQDITKPFDICDDGNTNDQPWDENESMDYLNEEILDKYLGTTFLLDSTCNNNNVATRVKVLKLRTDVNGRPIGLPNKNPLLDTHEYICENPDGTLDSYHANTISENLWSQCDTEGIEFMAYKEILDHRKNNKALPVKDGNTVEPKQTTINHGSFH